MKERFASLDVSNSMKQKSFILYWPQFATTVSIEISIANLQQKQYNKIYENLIVILHSSLKIKLYYHNNV